MIKYKDVEIKRLDDNIVKITVSNLFGTVYIDAEVESTKGNLKDGFKKYVNKQLWILSRSQRNMINEAIKIFEEKYN